MTDPSRWQTGQASYPPQPTPLYAQQLQSYQTTSNSSDVYDQSSQLQPLQQQQQQQQQQQYLPLRPLQPNPYPALGYPIYRYPKNGTNTIKESEQDKSDSRRTRISRACDACRRKKIKCDTNGPGNTCKNCKSSKLDCTFNDSAKKRGPPKGYIEVLENRLKRMEQILGNLTDDDELINKRRKSTPNDNDMTQNNHVTPTNTDNQTIAAEPGAATESSIKPLATELSSINTEMRTRYIGDMSPWPFLAQKINFEDARIASQIGVKIRRFGQSLVLYEKDDTSGKDANHKLLEGLGMLKPGETIKGLNDWIYKVAGVDKSTSDCLMKTYFAYIHPVLPVVNKLLFLKQYRGEIGEYPSAPLLNAIFGAAVRYIETCKLFGDKVPSDHQLDLKEGWSETLFENLIVYVKGRYSPCISTVQALVIGQNHRASLDEKMTSGWLLNSAAIRMAQDLGLHRSSDNWDIPNSEKETRKRVWWSVYIMDKWSAAATGRPQTIFDEDCDESYPNESADWEEVMDVPPKGSDNDGPRYPSLDKNVAQKAKSENIPIYQPFVQLVKLSEILGRLLQGLYTPLAKKHSEKRGSDAIVTYLDNALSEWRSALPPALQISSINVRRLDNHGRTPLLSMSGLMYLSYCTLLILLHRPFIEKDGGQKTRSSQSSLSICTSAATRCVDIAEKMHYRDFLLVSWNFAIYPVFTASLIHIYNAADPDTIVSDVAKSNLAKACTVIKRLSNLSTAAGRLYDVLDQLTKIRAIQMDRLGQFDDDGHSLHYPIWCSPSKKGKPPLIHTTSKAKPTDEHTHEDVSDGTTRISDVGRGSSIHQNTQRDSSAEVVSPSTAIFSDSEIVTSANSTPTSSGNGDWINGLYSSLQSNNVNQLNQQQQIQSQTPPPPPPQYPQAQQSRIQNSLESEPYSLRQFGLIMEQMNTPVNQLNNNQQAINVQPSYSTATTTNNNMNTNILQQPFMLPINPLDSFLFGLNDIGFTDNPIQIQQPLVSSYDNVSNNTTSTYPVQQQQQQRQQQQQQPMQQQTGIIDHTVFRNRPDNPFWSVPSSIELDDWTAYLLPQQPNNNNTANNSNNTPVIAASQQQASQASWNSTAQGWV